MSENSRKPQGRGPAAAAIQRSPVRGHTMNNYYALEIIVPGLKSRSWLGMTSLPTSEASLSVPSYRANLYCAMRRAVMEKGKVEAIPGNNRTILGPERFSISAPIAVTKCLLRNRDIWEINIQNVVLHKVYNNFSLHVSNVLTPYC